MNMSSTHGIHTLKILKFLKTLEILKFLKTLKIAFLHRPGHFT